MSFYLVYSLLLLQFVLGYAPFEHKSPGLLQSVVRGKSHPIGKQTVTDDDDDDVYPGYKRHSLQAVELSHRSQIAVQIVSNLSAPSNEGPIYRFWASRPCGHGWR